MKPLLVGLTALVASIAAFNTGALPQYKGFETEVIDSFSETARCMQSSKYPVIMCELAGEDGEPRDRTYCLPLLTSNVQFGQPVQWTCTHNYEEFSVVLNKVLTAMERLKKRAEEKAERKEKENIPYEQWKKEREYSI